MGSGRHKIKLSKNIWFVWSRLSYSGDMAACHASGQTKEHEDRARILEAEFLKRIKEE